MEATIPPTGKREADPPATIPPTGKREADPPTGEPDTKKLKHGEEVAKLDLPEMKDLVERFWSECPTESNAKKKLMNYIIFNKRRLTPEADIFMCKLIRGDDSPPVSPPPSPGQLPFSPADDEYGTAGELPEGYGWASYDPLLGGKDFMMKMWCARCGMCGDHWASKCTEKEGEGSFFKCLREGSYFKRNGLVKPSTSTSTSTE